jgi:hypothetical protein
MRNKESPGIYQFFFLRNKRIFNVLETKAYLHEAQSTFYVVRATLAIFILSVGKGNSNTQNAERISLTTVVRIILSMRLCVIKVQ